MRQKVLAAGAWVEEAAHLVEARKLKMEKAVGKKLPFKGFLPVTHLY